MRIRNRYDSSLVCLYALGKESLIPSHVRDQVPYSTASTWRHVDVSLFIGHELRTFHSEALDHYELLCKYRALKRTVCMLLRVWSNVAHIVLPALKKTKEHSERFMSALQELLTFIPRERALRLVQLSSSAFHDRLAQLKMRCGISPLERCFKRHPLQLALAEVSTIKALFAEPSFACWPASSIHFHGLRTSVLCIAKSTFYKYARLLGLTRRFPKAEQKRVGLRATVPNQYLHVDTTHWNTSPDQRFSIAIVSDNFSKAVLGWSIGTRKHAANVIGALQQAIATIERYHPAQVAATVVADGGGENHASTVVELLLNTEKPSITKIIAQEDIAFSNSPIEAINKILKRYLRHYKPASEAALREVVTYALNDYTNTRPHGTLDGLTPLERYTQPELKLDHRTPLAMARTMRIASNRIAGCGVCES